MKSLVFVDPMCPEPYNTKTPELKHIGGTENTIIRIAERLGIDCPVYVLQHNRKIIESGNTDVTYAPFEYASLITKVKSVVILRKTNVFPFFYNSFPKAKFFVLDTVISEPRFLMRHFDYLDKAKTTFLGKSKFHKNFIENMFKEHNLSLKNISFDYIYNHITDDLNPDNTVFDNKKLFFASQPEKALKYTLEVFNALRTKHPEFNLYIANPSYTVFHEKKDVGSVHFLSGISHLDVIKHLRSSLCLFYPNYMIPETFGNIFTEANAVGTPVLIHDFGAAKEVITNFEQFVDCTNIDQIIGKVVSWSKSARPKVFPNEKFRLNNVIKKWKKLLVD